MSLFNPFGLSSYTVNTANIEAVQGIEARVYLRDDVDKIFERKCGCNIFAVTPVEGAKYCYKCGGKLI